MTSCKERIHNMILDDIVRMESIEILEYEDINLLKSLYTHSIVQEDPYLKSKTQNLMLKNNVARQYITVFVEGDDEREREYNEFMERFYDAPKRE